MLLSICLLSKPVTLGSAVFDVSIAFMPSSRQRSQAAAFVA